MKTFDDIRKLADEYSALMAERNGLLSEIEKIYLLVDDQSSDDAQQGIKRTFSTDGRDSVLGVTRILAAAEPRFHDADSESEDASKLEQLCTALWQNMSKLNGSPLHYDIALTATLYGEVHIAIERTEDLAEDAGNRRAKRAANICPVSARVINPKCGWPVFDRFGLAAYYSEQDFRWSEIIARFTVPVVSRYNVTDSVTVREWWDDAQHVIWVEDDTTPLISEPNTGDIPISAAIIEGSKLFENGEYNHLTRQPFLYGMYKSGLWARQNLYLTVLYTQAFTLGRYSKMVFHANQDGKLAPDVDNGANSIVSIGPGEAITPLIQQIIDPQLVQAGQFAFEKGEQTTIYKQVLGQPMGGGVAFSTVSLLSQAGRLPIIPIQRVCGLAIARAMNNALSLLKAQGGKIKVGGKVWAAADIPECPEIECELEAALPQDDRLNAMVAQQLAGGDNPLTSMEYARTNVLKIEQPDVEQEKIWKEQAAKIAVTKELAMQMQEAEQMLQQAMQPKQQAPMQQPPQMQAPQPGQPIDPTSTGAQMGAPGMPMAAPVDQQMMQPGGMEDEQYPGA